MRKTSAPGNVSGRFADYDAITNPAATVIDENWLNDVQDELLGVQDEAGIAEAAGTNKYVLSAIKYLAIKHGKQLGELLFLPDYKSPAAFDKDDPESFFPAVCLSDIETYRDISSSNFSALVTNLRGLPVYYERNKTGEKYQFDVTGWAIASNVATLTFANTTAENEILSALAADNVVHGGYTNWQTITLASAIGDITAGDYAITDVDTVARTVSFAFTASDNTGSVTATASFYRHRVAGSTTTARLFQISEDALMSVGNDRVSMFRQLDQMQGHYHSGKGSGALGASAGFAGSSALSNDYDSGIQEPITDGSNGTPRTGDHTRPKNTAALVYMWAQDYAA